MTDQLVKARPALALRGVRTPRPVHRQRHLVVPSPQASEGVIPVLKRLISAAAVALAMAIPVASVVVVSQDVPAARGGYGDWPV